MLRGISIIHYHLFTAVELHKLEKRQWLSPEIAQEPEKEPIVSLNLPVPTKSHNFNVLQNHKFKRSFFQLLGLKTVTYEAKIGKSLFLSII